MKKRLFTLLLLLCPMLIAGMASASQLYLIGDSPFGNEWTTNNVKAMTLESDGVTNTFTGTSDGDDYFAICTGPTANSNDWTTMNGQLRYGWTGEIQDGGTYTLTQGEKTMHITEPGEWKITVNSETMVMTVEKLAAAADKWSIIGGIFDTNWNTDWDMTLGADGKYTLTVTDKEMMAGTYEYKARKNHGWGTSIPSGNDNASLTIPEDGIYKVVFTLDVEDETVSAVATKTGSAVIEKIYTVVGTPAAIFGTVWDPSLKQNEMVKGADGVTYTFTKENVELETGNIEFKVIVGHSWGGIEYGNNGQNIVYEVEEAGTYNVTITFNSKTEDTPIMTLEKVETHTYTVVGASAALFGETWNPAYTANDMTLSSDGQTYTWTKEGVELEAGTIQYKVAQDRAWDVCYPSGDNSTKTIDEAGIYNVTITLNPSTDTEPTMTATLVGKVITIGEYGYATYCGNLDLDFSNTTRLQAFAVTDVADGVMMLTEFDGGVKAGEAAILKGDEGTYQVPVAASEPASIDGNMLIGNSTSAAIEVTADNTTYRFGYSPLAGKVGFMKATSNFTVGAGKAYLKVGMAAAPEFIGFDGTATGIDTANVSTEDVKGERYNLNGQRVNASYRGVVIMSGKKYIQK